MPGVSVDFHPAGMGAGVRGAWVDVSGFWVVSDVVVVLGMRLPIAPMKTKSPNMLRQPTRQPFAFGCVAFFDAAADGLVVFSSLRKF